MGVMDDVSTVKTQNQSGGEARVIYCVSLKAAQNIELVFLRAFLLGLSSLCLPAS